MQRPRSADQLGEHWTHLPEGLALLTDLTEPDQLDIEQELPLRSPE